MRDDKDLSYQDMSGGGKEGGQSITREDNSIHSKYHDEPMVNGYENSRKSFYGKKGFDWSEMKGSK